MCCADLRRNGLLGGGGGRRWCEDRIATVPDVIDHEHDHDDDYYVVPECYLALLDDGGRASTGGFVIRDPDRRDRYRRNRRPRVVKEEEEEEEDGERESESPRDGIDEERGVGLGAYSPFHLTGFSSAGVIDGGGGGGGGVGSSPLPLRGDVEGVLSDDGGMHRAYRQRMRVFLDVVPEEVGHKRYRSIVNATIFLPISESVFVDADDPFLVRYHERNSGSTEGSSCGMSISFLGDRDDTDDNDNDTTSITTTTIRYGSSSNHLPSKCDIEFVNPGTIDIEQPSFASRQYVVAE